MLSVTDNYPLKNITTLQIGGPAKKFVSVSTEEELIEATLYAKQNNLEFLVIGGGSNLLVSDEGVDKLVIKNDINGIDVIPAKVLQSRGPQDRGAGIHKISVKSGTVLQDLVNYSIQHGLFGLQKLTGIPGTVGGAVFGNAGAYGQTISDCITSVVILNPSVIASPKGVAISTDKKDSHVVRHGGLLGMTLTKEECNFNYRDSVFKRNKYIILEVTFQLDKGDPKILQQEADEVLSKRLIKYPPGIKCPGSFFKNIVAETLPKEILDKISPGKIVYGKLPAGSLLEEVGAKGDSIDGIHIASYHANLFINKGSGKAEDFYNLARKYALLVKEKFGIKLEPEVQLINLPSLN